MGCPFCVVMPSGEAAGGRFGGCALWRMLLMDEIISVFKICESLYFVLIYLLIVCVSIIILCDESIS